MNVPSRLDRLRRAKGMTWIELGDSLGISRTWMHEVKKGKKLLGIKAEHRLLQAEREAGLNIREEESLAAIRRTALVSQASGERVVSEDVLNEELRGLHLADQVRALQDRAETAEQKLDALRRGMRELLATSEAAPGKARFPGSSEPDDANQIKGARPDSAEAAFAGRDAATQILKRQQAEKRAQRGGGSARPLSNTGEPSGDK